LCRKVEFVMCSCFEQFNEQKVVSCQL
jgi:hypothetical protein